MENILLVDDESDILDIFSELLSTHYKVSCCEDIESAKELIDKFEYSLLISDYNLNEEQNGIDLCQYYKQKTNKPTVLFTGLVDMFEKKFDDIDIIVPKPCPIEVLQRIIKERLYMK